MALRSMTGYGSGHAALGGVRVDVQVSTVNRRQLDVQLNLPRSLTALESRATKAIQAMVGRGRITVDARIAYTGGARRAGIQINHDLAAAYLAALRRTAGQLDLPDNLQAEVLLALPDVLRYEQADEDAERVWPPLQRALRAALRKAVAMRRDEGRSLERDILSRIECLRSHAEAIRARAPHARRHYQAALAERLAEAGLAGDNAEERLLREVAIYADRLDISEELIRLDSHFRQAGRMIRAPGPQGKSLDFLAQEMFREVNTIASKANDSRIAHHVIHCKTELERIREQVQNIE